MAVTSSFSLLNSLQLFLPASLLAIAQLGSTQNVGITCYGVGGFTYANNTQCPGSSACCGVKATCLPNRLCHNPGDNAGTFVRGPCAKNPYDTNSCAQICLYNETAVAGGVLPRVSQCEDGSWCCQNDAGCCGNSRGVFLDDNGIIASTAGSIFGSSPTTVATTVLLPTTIASTITSISSAAPVVSSISTTFVSTTSSRSITSTTSAVSSSTSGSNSVQTQISPATTTTSPTTGTAITDTATSQSAAVSTGDTAAMKMGLGLGIPLAALITGLAVWCWTRRRKRSAAHGASFVPETHYAQSQQTYPPQDAAMMSSQDNYYEKFQPPVEMWSDAKRPKSRIHELGS